MKLLRKGQVLLFEELEVHSLGFELRKSGTEIRLTSTAEYQYYDLSVDTFSIWYAKKSEHHKRVPVLRRTHSLMEGASRPTDAATALLADFTNLD